MRLRVKVRWRLEESSRQGWPRAFGEFEDGVDAAEALGPCAAEELGADGLGLIVEGVGGRNGIDFAGGEEPAEPGVAQTARGFLDGFAGLSLGGAGLGGGVDALLMEGEAEGRGEGAGKVEVGVGLGAAQAVVKMGGVKDQAQFAAALVEGTEQGHGVRSAGEADGQAQAGAEERGRDWQRGGLLPGRFAGRRRGTHASMIRRWGIKAVGDKR
jgi:hypothetical protein